MKSVAKFIHRTVCRFVLVAIGLGSAVLPAHADYPSTVVADGPSGYWRFNDATVVTPIPLMATNLGTVGAPANGNYSGGVVRGVPGALAGSTASYFTGGSWVQAPNSAALNPNPPFSIEFWIKPNPVAGALTCPLSSTDFTPSPRLGWLFYTDAGYSGGYVSYGYYFRAYSTAGTIAVASPAGLLTTNWTHVAGVVDGVHLLLYVNGQLVGSSAWSGAFTPNTAQSIGIGTRYDAGFPQDGSMNEVAIYGSALSATDVKAHYDAATTNAPGYASQILAAAPVAYWRLNEPPDVYPVASNAGTLGAAANGGYHYWSTTTPDLDGPSFAGFADTNSVFEPSGTNGIVTVPPLKLNTNTVTFECWIKRNGDQSSFAGILFHRGGTGTATGLDFHDTSNNLGYHWSDQANTYGWVSGLLPPDGVWTYVALAVAPSEATIYMYDGTNWTSAVNFVDHPVQPFNATLRIGADSDTSRFFNGRIDEAAIYPQTLTEGQLHTHALAGFGSTNPPAMVTDPPVVAPAGVIYSTTPFTLTADAYGQPPLSFQWRLNGNPVPGATQLVYGKASASTADSGNYDVVITNAYGAVTSQVAVVTIDPAVPPTIARQPLSRSCYAGGTASFSVQANGTTPFSYQWTHAGTNLPGATAATLWVTNVNTALTGSYGVTVTNVAGSALSSLAGLSIYTPAANSYEGAVVALGPLAYWRLNETSGTVAFDDAGGFDSTHVGGVAVGQPGPRSPDFPGFEPGNDAVGFDGTTSSSSSPGVSLLNNRTNLTVSGWVNPIVLAQGGLFGQNDVFEFRFLNSATIELWTPYGSIDYGFGSSISPGQWYFLTAVATSNALMLYVNGQAVATATSTAANGYGTSASPFLLSGNTSGNGDPSLNGMIDEVAVFPRALAASEVAALYATAAYGTVTRPFVTRQPVPQTTAAGSTATFSVAAGGSLPLAYQWQHNGINLAGATGTTLTLPSAYYTDAGTYSVQITNAVGSTNSAAALLTVLPPPTFANLTNDLVLHLKFDGTFQDSSGQANDASAVGSPGFIAGRLGQGVHLSSSSSLGYNYLIVSDVNSDFSFDVTNSFSVALWLRYTVGFNDLPVIGNAVNSTYQKGWVITEDTGKVDWTLTGIDTGQTIADPVGPLINDGNWHQIAVSFDRNSGLASTFVDGAKVDTRSIAAVGSLITGYTLTLGQDPSGAYGVSGGFDLDDVGVWRRALTDYEASSIFAAAQSSGESFDVYGPVKVSVNLNGTNADVSWQSGTLLQSTNAAGPYVAVQGATAPFYRTTAGGKAVFFRVRQ